MYSVRELKQFVKVKYCIILNQSFSGESMTVNVTDKVNSRNHVMPWYNFFLVMLSQLDFKISKKKKKNQITSSSVTKNAWGSADS